MTSLVQQNTTQMALKFLLVLTSDHITGATGLSPTVTICKEGGSFAAPAGAVTEIANGWYQVAANATDTNTVGELLLHATAATADPFDGVVAQVVTWNPTGPSNIRKNTAINNFMFVMTAGGNPPIPTTGLTVSAFRNLDGAGFFACANTVTEVGSGWYQINLSASDTNGNRLALRFTAPGANDLDILLITTQ